MKTTYQTPVRRALMALFSSHPHRHFTAEQVCTLLCQTNHQGTALMGKSTIYRQLSSLCDQKLLRRFEDTDSDGNAVHVYQYANAELGCETHLHLKCLRCGKVSHLDCEVSEQLLTHIRASHAFSVDGANSILYGLCHACEQQQHKEEQS